MSAACGRVGQDVRALPYLKCEWYLKPYHNACTPYAGHEVATKPCACDEGHEAMSGCMHVLVTQAMKRRLGSKASAGFLFIERPFFHVDVELKV
eukprot:1158208-Pelagomonas_calceolata.AAC.41